MHQTKAKATTNCIIVYRPPPACQIDYRLKFLLLERISITTKIFNFTQQCAIAHNSEVRFYIPGHTDACSLMFKRTTFIVVLVS